MDTARHILLTQPNFSISDENEMSLSIIFSKFLCLYHLTNATIYVNIITVQFLYNAMFEIHLNRPCYKCIT